VRRRFSEQDFEDEQARADHDSAIGHIECGPLVLTYIEKQEIHHVTADQAVPKVADRASENKRQPHAGRGHRVTVLPEEGRNDYQGDQGEQNKNSDFPLRRGVGE
jgi:hypothetical protein